MRKNKKGFTLVELVIVIAVIAILAAVLLPTFAGIVERSKLSAVTQRAEAVRKEVYAKYFDSIEDMYGIKIIVNNDRNNYNYKVDVDGKLVKLAGAAYKTDGTGGLPTITTPTSEVQWWRTYGDVLVEIPATYPADPAQKSGFTEMHWGTNVTKPAAGALLAD